jgi:multiple sugar transport system permease protein
MIGTSRRVRSRSLAAQGGAPGHPQTRTASRRLRWGWIATKMVVYVMLGIGTVIMVGPLLWMIATSLSTDQYATSFPPQFFPTTFDLRNYVRVFTDDAVGRYLLNSVLIVVPSMIGQVVSSSLAGYAFARLRAPGRRFWFIATLSTIMIPYEVTIVPTFVMFRYLHWLNTLWPLIVPQLAGCGFNIFLMRQFISSIPRELDEAARVDACGFFAVWWRIIVPLTMAPMVTIAIFTFAAQWGSFLGPLIYINDPSKFPLALGLYLMTQTSNVGQAPPWNIIMAGSMLLTVPMVLVYFFGQRFLYEGANMLSRIR